MSRSLGGPDVDWLAAAEAYEKPGHPWNGGGVGAESHTAAPNARAASLGGIASPSGGQVSGNLLVSQVAGGGAEAAREELGVGGGGGGGEGQSPLVLTLADLEVGEKRLPPPSSSMKMGCPKIPQVITEAKEARAGEGAKFFRCVDVDRPCDGRRCALFVQVFRESEVFFCCG